MGFHCGVMAAHYFRNVEMEVRFLSMDLLGSVAPTVEREVEGLRVTGSNPVRPISRQSFFHICSKK